MHAQSETKTSPLVPPRRALFSRSDVCSRSPPCAQPAPCYRMVPAPQPRQPLEPLRRCPQEGVEIAVAELPGLLRQPAQLHRVLVPGCAGWTVGHAGTRQVVFGESLPHASCVSQSAGRSPARWLHGCLPLRHAYRLPLARLAHATAVAAKQFTVGAGRLPAGGPRRPRASARGNARPLPSDHAARRPAAATGIADAYISREAVQHTAAPASIDGVRDPATAFLRDRDTRTCSLVATLGSTSGCRRIP